MALGDIVGLFGNKSYPSPMEDDVYQQKTDKLNTLKRDALYSSGPTLADGLGMALASALPLAVGALIDGGEGLGASLGGAAQGADLYGKYAQADREQRQTLSLLEALQLQDQLEGANAYKAEEAKSKRELENKKKEIELESSMKPNDSTVMWKAALRQAGGDEARAQDIYLQMDQANKRRSAPRVTVYNSEKSGLPDKVIEAVSAPISIAQSAQDLTDYVTEAFPSFLKQSYLDKDGNVDISSAAKIIGEDLKARVGGSETEMGQLQQAWGRFQAQYQKLMSGLAATDTEFERLSGQIQTNGLVPATIPTMLKVIQRVKQEQLNQARTQVRAYEAFSTPGDKQDKFDNIIQSRKSGPRAAEDQKADLHREMANTPAPDPTAAPTAVKLDAPSGLSSQPSGNEIPIKRNGVVQWMTPEQAKAQGISDQSIAAAAQWKAQKSQIFGGQ